LSYTYSRDLTKKRDKIGVLAEKSVGIRVSGGRASARYLAGTRTARQRIHTEPTIAIRVAATNITES